MGIAFSQPGESATVVLAADDKLPNPSTPQNESVITGSVFYCEVLVVDLRDSHLCASQLWHRSCLR